MSLMPFPAAAQQSGGYGVQVGAPRAFSPYRNPRAAGAPEVLAVTDDTSVAGDSAPGFRSPHPVTPSAAMLHSLAIPGWGQYKNGRRWKAALFFTAETVCIGGFLYLSHRIRTDGDLSDWDRDLLRTDRNTYVIYWFAAKLLGIVDAYVDAQLADFDVEDITPPELRDRDEIPPQVEDSPKINEIVPDPDSSE